MNLEHIWKSVLAELELSMSKATFQTHFANSQLLSLEEQVAKIGIVNPMIRNMVESRYYQLVKSILDHHSKLNTSLVFSALPPKSTAGNKANQPTAGPLFEQSMAAGGEDLKIIAKRLHIRADATFDNFAVSGGNQIAYAASTAVSKSLGSAYNPLFIYGGVGVGKTHLMHAVANALLTKKQHAKIVYCMGEEFLNDIVEGIQTKTMRVFKQKYRSAELLLVDDVQFIAGKQTAQEEFFHTFNAVHGEGGQIILTSDRHPSEIAKLEDRLRSRFEGGLIVDVSPPDFELRMAIVNIKSQALHVSVPSDVAQAIAANVTDTRAIEGLLKRILTETLAHKAPITVEVVNKLLRGNNKSEGEGAQVIKSRKVSPQTVLDAVAEHFGIKITTLKGPKRDRPIARPRQVVMYLCKNELGLTLDDIGGLLGGRDHTTVIHGVDTISRELPTNMHLRDSVEGIKQKLWA